MKYRERLLSYFFKRGAAGVVVKGRVSDFGPGRQLFSSTQINLP